MNIAATASSVVVANQAQTMLEATNAMIKQQHSAEQAVVRMLDQAVSQPAKPATAGGVDITV
jgi:hypothetical protein